MEQDPVDNINAIDTWGLSSQIHICSEKIRLVYIALRPPGVLLLRSSRPPPLSPPAAPDLKLSRHSNGESRKLCCGGGSDGGSGGRWTRWTINKATERARVAASALQTPFKRHPRPHLLPPSTLFSRMAPDVLHLYGFFPLPCRDASRSVSQIARENRNEALNSHVPSLSLSLPLSLSVLLGGFSRAREDRSAFGRS